MKKTWILVQQNWIYLLTALLFTLWALAFIHNSSYRASDGRLYFALFDDAMISMRYAWNFAHGNGLVWNKGEYVEGYTNLLMTLIMSIPSFFFEKRFAVLAIQLTGIFFMLATAFITVKIYQISSKRNSLAEYLLFLTILLYYPLNFWSLMGMETGLLAFLLSSAVLYSLKYKEDLQGRHLWLASLSFGLAYLARNDSIVYGIPVFIYLTQTFKSGKKYIYWYLLGCLVYALFPIGQTIFRYFYYGAVVPNTYLLKLAGIPLDLRLSQGWIFVQKFLMEIKIPLGIAVISLFLKPSKQKFLFFALFLVAISYETYVGGDPWNYWRIMAPSMPFIYILVIAACTDLPSPPLPRPVHSLGIISIAFICFYTVNSRFFREISLTDIPYDSWDAKRHIETSILINKVTYENATIGVFWAGTLPYYLDRKAIDFLGKSDSYIASLPPDISTYSDRYLPPGHNKYDLTYSIQQLLPTYVEGFVWGPQDLTEWRDIHYVKTTNKYVEIYLLKDSVDVNWNKVKIAKNR